MHVHSIRNVYSCVSKNRCPHYIKEHQNILLTTVSGFCTVGALCERMIQYSANYTFNMALKYPDKCATIDICISHTFVDLLFPQAHCDLKVYPTNISN